MAEAESEGGNLLFLLPSGRNRAKDVVLTMSLWAYGRDNKHHIALVIKARRAVNNLKFIWAASRSRLFLLE